MRLLDRIILTLYTFCLALASILLILFPFEKINYLSIASIEPYLKTVKGNYWFSIIGLAFLLVSIRFLISGLTRSNKNNYILKHTKFGELRISSQTIEGLAHSVTEDFHSIKDIKTNVDLSADKIIIKIKGLVNPDINIPETTEEMQNKIKTHVESCTGVEVSEIKVEVNNITESIKAIK